MIRNQKANLTGFKALLDRYFNWQRELFKRKPGRGTLAELPAHDFITSLLIFVIFQVLEA